MIFIKLEIILQDMLIQKCVQSFLIIIIQGFVIYAKNYVKKVLDSTENEF